MKTLSVIILFSFSHVLEAFFPNSFRASFTEERTSLLSGKKVSNSGTVEYKYPTHLRFEVAGPIKTTLVVAPTKTWYYTAPFIEGEKGELKITSTKEKSLGRVFDLIQKGLTSNADYRVEKKGTLYSLIPSPKLGEELGVERIELVFKKDPPLFEGLESMNLFYDQRSKRYKFKEIVTPVSFPPDHFQFNPPPHTNVSTL